MKKLVIRAGLTVGSLIIFAVAANAQSQYRADIPFDFQAAGKAYTAGGYLVGRISPAVTALIIRDRKTGKAGLLGHANLGGDRWKDTGKLIFVKADGRYTLSEIVTPSFAMKLIKTKTDVRMAGVPAAKLETVAINLR